MNPFPDTTGLVLLTPLQISLLLNSYANATATSSSPQSPSTIEQQLTNLTLPSLTHLLPSTSMFDVALQLRQQQQQRSMSTSSSSLSAATAPALTRINRYERTKLFVGNLPDGTTLMELFELFKPYGHINHQLCVVKEGNYAFIHYFSEKAAEQALHGVNGVWFRNRYLRVEYSVSSGHLAKKLEKSNFFYPICPNFLENLINFWYNLESNDFCAPLKNSKSSFHFPISSSSSTYFDSNKLASVDFSAVADSAASKGQRPIRGQRMTTSQSVNFTTV